MKKRLMKKRLKQALDKPYLCEVVDYERLMRKHGYGDDKLAFRDGETVLMLGEIEQMPGHVAVVKRDGRVMWGYHAENFRKLTREES